MNLRVFYLTRRGISDGYFVSHYPPATKTTKESTTVNARKPLNIQRLSCVYSKIHLGSFVTHQNCRT